MQSNNCHDPGLYNTLQWGALQSIPDRRSKAPAVAKKNIISREIHVKPNIVDI